MGTEWGLPSDEVIHGSIDWCYGTSWLRAGSGRTSRRAVHLASHMELIGHTGADRSVLLVHKVGPPVQVPVHCHGNTTIVVSVS